MQVDCWYDNQEQCRILTDKVSQTLFDHADDFDRVYDVHDLKRVLGPIPGPPESNARQSKMIMDFECYTYRAVT